MRHQASNRRLNRVGFTLIEMLMVFLIIAILIGLLVPVISGAFKRGKRAAESTEINGLATALQQFKDRFGVYPPSQFILREDGAYYSASAGNPNPIFIPASSTGQDTAVFDEDLTIQYIRRIWPQMVIHTDGTAVTPAEIGDINGDGLVDANDFYDWNNDGVLGSPAQVQYLQADECLVFFLGGIPVGEVSPGVGSGSRLNSGPPGMLGFGKKPKWPTERIIGGTTSTSRDGPFYEFKERLMDRDADQFYELIPSRNSGQAPYVYFSAYEGAGYRPDDFNVTIEPNGEAMQTANFGVSWRISNTYPSPPRQGAGTTASPYYLNSLGPNPYTAGPSYPSTFAPGWVTRYQKPDSFQLISPGSDVAYGPGGELPIPTDPVRDRDQDNLTNFFADELKDMPR